MSSKMNRRNFLQVSGLSILGASSLGKAIADETATPASAHVAGPSFGPAPIPQAKGPRAVVVGGGWSGLTMAKYLKRHNPKFDVVLIDRNSLFISCPMSNLWLADQVDMDFLTHSYTDAAKNHDYIFFNATVIDMDRESQKIFTELGYIHYDYLVLAPGIDYDYSRIGVEDPSDEYTMRAHYPGGFVGASEYVSIKKKLHTFKGGNFVMTVPNGNYRCMAAPYERACMAAGIFKKRGVRGKIQLLDMNPDITIKAEGFRKAFETFYPDLIEYIPSTEISAVDLGAKEIQTDFDSYGFDDAIIYPPIRASRLIEQFGLHNPASIQKEGNIDKFKYNVIGDEHIYITGDSRAQPFSKSGNTANTEGKYVAEVIAAHSEGKEVEWRSPQTMCFSGVKIDPLEAMSIIAFYKYDKEESTFAFDRAHMIEEWSDRGAQAGFAWAEGMYKDMFYT